MAQPGFVGWQASDPGNVGYQVGDFYYNTATTSWRYFNGTVWANSTSLANISAQLLLVNYATASVTLAAAATSNIQNYTGAGTVIILYSGDGDGSFNMQVVVDGVLDDTLPTNQQGIYIGTYASTLVVRVQNPTAGSLTKKTSTFRLSGINFS